MARRANQNTIPDPELVEEQAPPLVGGSEGIPPDMATTISEPGKVSAVGYQVRDPSIEVVIAKRYKVLRESRFVSGGYVGVMRAGKIIDDAQYNIAAVKAQGVPLEELV